MRIEKEDGTPFTTTDDSNQPLPIVQRESGTPVDFILHSVAFWVTNPCRITRK